VVYSCDSRAGMPTVCAAGSLTCSIFSKSTMSILSLEKFLKCGQAFRIANYVCHRTDTVTSGCDTGILVRLGIVHHTLSVPSRTYLEATATQLILASKPVEILAAYFSQSRPLIGGDLTACFVGGLPVLLAGDLNAKNVGCNTYLTFGSDTPTTNPYKTSPLPDVFILVITKDLSFPYIGLRALH